jgi:predicted nucleic acid-binding Zn ribbon protein
MRNCKNIKQMFRRDVKSVRDLVLQALREQGLETPLNQKRLVDAWSEVVGEAIASYTLNKYIYNQTLYVRLSSPALRADLSMRRQELTAKLNAAVGEQIITDVRFG